ncbi:MAG: formate/nitrite family transporter [Anaerolineae bacterium]|nr:formate/nitrite family transporter [Anaerolineae bacterium]
MATKAEDVGVAKANLDTLTMLGLAVLAGAFIGLGAIFMTTVTTGAAGLPFGVGKLLGGLVFCLGLILVVVAGAELFTGNNLIVMAFMSGKVSFARLMRNWAIVYLGNLIGSVATAVVMFLSQQYRAGAGLVGVNALTIANSKCSLGFTQAVALGIMCNALVCLAVWLCFSARTTTDKILSIIFPITAFVAAGFEHSVANMYFIPIGWLIKTFDPAFIEGLAAAGTPVNVANVTVARFLVANLLPVTIGNIIGGAGLVGFVYWAIYLRPRRSQQAAAAASAKR